MQKKKTFCNNATFSENFISHHIYDFKS